MKKAIETIEYLVSVLGQNLLALKAYEPETAEGRAYLDSWADQLGKIIVLMAKLRTGIQGSWRPIESAPRNCWIMVEVRLSGTVSPAFLLTDDSSIDERFKRWHPIHLAELPSTDSAVEKRDAESA